MDDKKNPFRIQREKYRVKHGNCYGNNQQFQRILDFYTELGWLKKEFKKRLNWELNKQWFINWNKENGRDDYFLYFIKGIINTKNVLKVEHFFKLIDKKLKVIKIKRW